MILSADPGIGGGIACYSGHSIHLFRMPVAFQETAKGKKKIVDGRSIGDILAELKPQTAYIEKVGAMPNQGVVSMFSFGMATGTLHGAIESRSIPIRLVRAQEWKEHFGLIKKDKKESNKVACSLWPEHKANLCKPSWNGVAEAALIAYFAYHELEGRK